MGQLAVGSVVVVPFPFSDLTQTKRRPAVVVASTAHGDWVLCQVTSNPYGDPSAGPLTAACFAEGSLPLPSFVRPGKLFTAHESLVLRVVGQLTPYARRQIVEEILRLFWRADPWIVYAVDQLVPWP